MRTSLQIQWLYRLKISLSDHFSNEHILELQFTTELYLFLGFCVIRLLLISVFLKLTLVIALFISYYSKGVYAHKFEHPQTHQTTHAPMRKLFADMRCTNREEHMTFSSCTQLTI